MALRFIINLLFSSIKVKPLGQKLKGVVEDMQAFSEAAIAGLTVGLTIIGAISAFLVKLILQIRKNRAQGGGFGDACLDCLSALGEMMPRRPAIDT